MVLHFCILHQTLSVIDGMHFFLTSSLRLVSDCGSGSDSLVFCSFISTSWSSWSSWSLRILRLCFVFLLWSTIDISANNTATYNCVTTCHRDREALSIQRLITFEILHELWHPNIRSTNLIRPHVTYSSVRRVFLITMPLKRLPLVRRGEWVKLATKFGTGIADVTIFMDAVFVFSICSAALYLAFYCNRMVWKLEHL